MSQQYAAALQIAAWVVRETSRTFNLTAGSVQYRNASDPTVLRLAQTMLNAVVADTLSGNPYYQNNIRALSAVETLDTLIQVPDPETALLTGGVLLLLGVRWRRSRKGQGRSS